MAAACTVARRAGRLRPHRVRVALTALVAATTMIGSGVAVAPPAVASSGPSAPPAATTPVAPSWAVAHTAAPQSPEGEIVGMSCLADGFCAAVGRHFGVRIQLVGFAEVRSGGVWTVSELPPPPGATEGTYPSAVSCTSASWCMAVGSYQRRSGPETPFSEVWDGNAWTFGPAAVPAHSTGSSLEGVSCTAPTSCVAVGNALAASGSVTLAERWNGSTWTVADTPDPVGGGAVNLASVSCTSTTGCSAVGSYRAASGSTVGLIERWDGVSWARQANADPFGSPISVLNSVSCVDGVDCVAVGRSCSAATVLQCLQTASDRPLVEVWDGTAWRLQSTTGPSAASGFTAVSCTAPVACVAVGHQQTAAGDVLSLAEVWDGVDWRVTPTPSPSDHYDDLDALACTSSSCVGGGLHWDVTGTIVVSGVSWDGSAWTEVDLPPPATDTHSGLTGMSCSSPSACVAVGGERTVTGSRLGFAEVYDGRTWTLSSVPVPAPFAGTVLTGISCVTATFCMAVGWFQTQAARYQTVAEIWDGRTWTVSLPGNPSAARSELNGVSCVSTTSCVAVGYEGNLHYLPLAETWNGATWTPTPVPAPRASWYLFLDGVSCTSSTACVAVGSYRLNSGAVAPPLAEVWDGTTWTVETTVVPTGQGQTTFNAVSCIVGGTCVAVGSDLDASYNGVALAEVRRGGTWSLASPPDPASATQVALDGVTCQPSGTCVAVGSTGSLLASYPLAEAWSGTAWTPQPVAAAPGADQSALAAVSCPTPVRCAAGGHTGTLHGSTERPLVETSR